jgi:hypothetical protein
VAPAVEQQIGQEQPDLPAPEPVCQLDAAYFDG